MKIALTLLLIIGFAGTAIFGVFAMNHGAAHGHEGCIAAAAQGTDCPREENAFSFLNFHSAAFQSFSTAIFGESIASALISFAVLALAAALGVFAKVSTEMPAFAAHSYRAQFLESCSLSFQQKFVHWLALHENSPSAPSGRG